MRRFGGYAAIRVLPDEVFDIPTWTHPKVAPDRHAQVAKALYSLPGELVGRRAGCPRRCAHSETVLAW
ncbi:MAG TPA: hypothetical protein VFC01_29375 [Mycobacterium sp.]|jgi:hypothetical protein|nr:hypothetical protein [Mycobacterium sp.]